MIPPVVTVVPGENSQNLLAAGKLMMSLAHGTPVVDGPLACQFASQLKS